MKNFRMRRFKRTMFVVALMASFGLDQSRCQNPAEGSGRGSFLDVGGSKLYYEECGASPQTVVLIHDGVVNSSVWNEVWPEFCKQFHTIRYDRRGFGRSSIT